LSDRRFSSNWAVYNLASEGRAPREGSTSNTQAFGEESKALGRTDLAVVSYRNEVHDETNLVV
jgi:hypothetical protein